MAAYIIVGNEVTDPVAYEEYRKVVPATVEKYGGKFIVRGGKFEKLEGEAWQPKRVVVVEFPSYEQAKAWYDSEEYRGPKEMRQQASVGDIIVVEGV